MAGNGGLGLVFGQTQRALDAAGASTRHVAGHALDQGIVVGLDDDVIVAREQLEGRVDDADGAVVGRLCGGRYQAAGPGNEGDGQGNSPGKGSSLHVLKDGAEPHEMRTTKVNGASARPACAGVRHEKGNDPDRCSRWLSGRCLVATEAYPTIGWQALRLTGRGPVSRFPACPTRHAVISTARVRGSCLPGRRSRAAPRHCPRSRHRPPRNPRADWSAGTARRC